MIHFTINNLFNSVGKLEIIELFILSVNGSVKGLFLRNIYRNKFFIGNDIENKTVIHMITNQIIDFRYIQ